MSDIAPDEIATFHAPDNLVLEVAIGADARAVDATTREEVQRWLSATPDDIDDTRLDPSLTEALTLTAIFTYAVGGYIGNFTYDLFPNAADFIKRSVGRGSRVRDVDGAGELAVAHALRHHAAPTDAATLDLVRLEGDGSWRAVVALTSGVRVKVWISPAGQVIKSRRY